MKFKHLIIVSLIMTILTMGIVSATEDVNASDALTINDQADGETVLQQDMEVQVESVDESMAVEGADDAPVKINIFDEVEVDVEPNYFLVVSDEGYLDGNVTFVIDDNDVYTKDFHASQKETSHGFDLDFLKETPSFGYHKINATYQKNGVSTLFNKVKMVDFRYTFIWGQNYPPLDYDMVFDDNLYAYFLLPEGSNGTVNFKFNSKNYTLPIVNGQGWRAISIKGLKVGEYILEAQFNDASNYYPARTIEVPIRIVPKIHYSSVVAVDDKDSISITAHKDSKINAILYKYNGYKDVKVAQVSGNTKVIIPLEKAIAKGENELYLKCTIDGMEYWNECYIDGCINQKNVKSSISKKGDKVTVNLNGPKNNYKFGIYLDDGLIKTVKATKGKFKYVLSALDIGKHKIQIRHLDGYTYYKTFWVTVKAKDKVSLTLKKVNVKKSAKKLVLKATLKINKKAKKGLKVTFKFNGKKFTAKTDKTGVAKVTIKKKVLKKLKAGKKVKYSVKYSFKTVSQKVKVKR